MKLENSVIFITGGTSGYGYKLAKQLLIQEAKVVVVDSNKRRGDLMTEKEDPNQFLFIECDVTFRDQVKEAIEMTHSVFGTLDVVINCAGIFDVEPIIVRTGLNKFYTVPQGFFTNLFGSFYSSYYFTLYKGRGEGLIINVGPMINDIELGKLSRFFSIWTKVNSFTIPMTKYLNENNIRFLTISPSSMDILMPDINAYVEPKKTRAVILDSVIKRYRNHEEFVNLVIYAITNSHINGVELELGNFEYSPPTLVARI